MARLYTQTNPVVLRYLRVVSDQDPRSLALATWSELVDAIPTFDADEDDDWLELTVGTARRLAVAANTAAPGPDPAGAGSTHAGEASGTDPVSGMVAELRACGWMTADVLAMHIVAGLGRDSIARITEREPTEVLALVHRGQQALSTPLDSLVQGGRVAGNPAELGDLPEVLALFTASSQASLPTTPPYAASTQPSALPVLTASAPWPAAPSASELAQSPDEPTVVDLRGWDSPTQATPRVVLHHRMQPSGSSRWSRVGAGAAAWTVALAGVGTAAAMSGVIPATINNLFGDDNKRPVITAQGPARPGGAPTQPDGGDGSLPPPSAEGPDGPRTNQPQGEPQTVGQPTVPDDVVVGADFLSATGTATGFVVVSAAMTDSPPPPSSPTPPSAPGVTPQTPTQPGTGPGTGGPSGDGEGRGRPKPGTCHDKGGGKGKAAKGKAQTAKAKAKVKAAKAKAGKAKAAKAKAKAKCAKAAKGKSARAATRA